MKKVIFLIISILILSLTCNINAQKISDHEKQKIISNLSKSNPNVSLGAIMDVIDHKIDEAIPEILKNIGSKPLTLQYWYLIALKILGYANTHLLTIEYLVSLDANLDQSDEIDVDEYKFLSNNILYSLGDYTRTQNTFNYLQKISPESDHSMISQLRLIIENDPIHESQAKTELIKLAENCPDEKERWLAVSYLYDLYKENILPEIEKRLIEETDYGVKLSILYEIVDNYKNPKHHQLFVNQIQIDTCVEMPSAYAEVLFVYYATPLDYKLIKELIPKTKDEITRNYLTFRINKFTSFITDSASSVVTNIDSLISYQAQCASFKWLWDISFNNQINGLLLNAKTKLESRDSVSAAFRLKQYRSIINKEYRDTLELEAKYVTRDAFIFLYYYPKYILNRLPKVPWIESITPEITVRKSSGIQITISGSDFKSDATVLWNNTTQKIISVTDTLIRVEIDKKESNKEGIYKITVKNPDGIISNEAAFEITNKLEFPIIPVLECVRKNEDNSYTAYFGYDNKNGISVLLQIGEENKFDPSEHDRLQPEIFMPGRHKNIFSVKFDGRKIMWKLNKEKITADKNSPECK